MPLGACEQSESPFGRLRHVAPAARLSETPPALWAAPAVPLGTCEPAWSGRVGRLREIGALPHRRAHPPTDSP
jgi:hypothetical protein